MNHKAYLKYRETHPGIRLVGNRTWIVYKSKMGGYRKVLKFLKGDVDFAAKRIGAFKISEKQILQIQEEIKSGISKTKIAKKHGINVRTVYRYETLKLGKTTEEKT